MPDTYLESTLKAIKMANSRASGEPEIDPCNATTLRLIKDHPVLGPNFRAFALVHNRAHDIQFLDDYTAALEQPSKLANKLGKKLMETYFLPKSPFPVALSASSLQNLGARFQKRKFKSLLELFQSIPYEVIMSLKGSDAFQRFVLTDEEALKFIQANDILLLQTWLNNDTMEQALPLLNNMGDEKLLRLCNAVLQFEQCRNEKDKKVLGYKIWSLFLQRGSKYLVHDLPQRFLAEAIEMGHYEAMSELKLEGFHVLVQNGELMKHAAASVAAEKENDDEEEEEKIYFKS